MPDDLSTLLRDAVEPASGALDMDAIGARARRNRRRRAASGVLVALALGVAVTGTLAAAEDDQQQVAVGPGDTTSRTALAPTADDDDVFRIGDYMLDGLPDGMQVTGGSEEGPFEGSSAVLEIESDQVGDLRVIVTGSRPDQGSFTDVHDARSAVLQVGLDGEAADDVAATIVSSLDATEPIQVIVPLGPDEAFVVEVPAGNDDGTVLRIAQEVLDHLRVAPAVLPGEAEDAASEAFVRWLSARGDVEETVAVVEDGDALRTTIQAAIATAPFDAGEAHGYATAVEPTGDHGVLAVAFEIRGPNDEVVYSGNGTAVQVGTEWLVSRETYCTAIAVGSVRCPEDEGLVQGD